MRNHFFSVKAHTAHGGNIWKLARELKKPVRELLDFSASINPLGPPPSLRSILSGQIENLVHYPDPDNTELTAALAGYFGVQPQEVIGGNGSSELLYAIPRALKADRVILPAPCYMDYARAAEAAGLAVVHLLPENADFEISFERLRRELRGGEIVFIGQPNNPTGLLFDEAAFTALAARRRDTFFIVDEAFLDFIAGHRSVVHHNLPNVLALRSLTKFFAIPGLRLGTLLGPARIIAQIRRILPVWSVNHLAQTAGIACLADRDYAEHTRQFVKERRQELVRQLRAFPEFFVYPGTANYLLVRMDNKKMDAPALHAKLLKKNIAIRICDNFVGLDRRFFRVAVRTPEENKRLGGAIAEVLGIESSPHGNSEKVGQGPPWPSSGRPALPKNKRRCRDAHALPLAGTKYKGFSSGHPPALMIQGTGSWAGKSILTSAFCRIFLQDGFRVAPFKAQNMSLNSFVTLDGGEIGRAQALQASACRLEPDVRMNPVLLKPNSDTGAQVIVLGRPLRHAQGRPVRRLRQAHRQQAHGRAGGNMEVDQYIHFKPDVFKTVKRAYDQLASEYEVMVLEGAGSPAEVNLKAHDIVNMAMARHAGAKVLIAGDIDRGGVFASFAGTFDLLDNWERDLVAGFIINRFRGKAELLTEALEFIKRWTGRPVLGVVPYLTDLQLPEEDSATFKSRIPEPAGPAGFTRPSSRRSGALPCREDGKLRRAREALALSSEITVAVIDLPHISNFTDFDALRLEPDVVLRFVRKKEEIGTPDVLILPGSKNTAHDIKYLRTKGFDRKILESARNGKTEVIGICAGLQMLGERIHDPHHIESRHENTSGLNILPLATTLCETKTLKRVSGVHSTSGLAVHGYEIHQGQSKADGLVPIVRRNDGKAIGFGSRTGKVWGTYLHGIFDADEFRRWFVDRVRVRKGLAPIGRICARFDIEPELDRLADVVRKSVRIGEIYKLLELK
jgi:L-threonine-O-3-phosphate decarboxylase